MAVAFDAKATSDSGFTPPLVSPLVFSSMTPTAAATALVVFVDLGTSGTSTTLCTVSGVTWNGVSMTQLAVKTQSDGLFSTYAFGLASPATGNHNVSVSVTGGTLADCTAYVDAVSFSGTALTTAVAFPSGNVLTDASTPSGTAYPTTAFSVTTASGDAACAVMQCGNNQFSTTTGTLIRTDGAFNGNYSSAYRLAVGASTSLQFTGGASGSPAAGIAFRIQQPQAATPTWVPNADPKHDVAISTHAKIVAVALAAGYAFVPFNTPQINTKVAGWYQPLGVAPPVAQAQLGSAFVPFNTPQIAAGTPQGWESISSAAPPLASPQPGYSFVPFNTRQTNTATIDKWQQPLSIPVLAPAVQPGSASVPFNTAQINTVTIDKWQQPLSIPVLAPPVQAGNSFVPFNTLQLNTIAGLGWYQPLASTPPAPPVQVGASTVPFNTAQTNTAPLGWYQSLASTPSSPPALQGSISLSYNVAPVINTIAGMGWFQALAATPASAPAQIGASFVPFNTPQTVTAVSPWGWYQPLSLAPPVAAVTYTQPAWVPAPFPTFTLAWQSTSAIAPPVALPQPGYSFVPFNTAQTNTVTVDKWQQPLSIPVLSPPVQSGSAFVPLNTLQFNTAPMAWQQPLASTPASLPAQFGSTTLSYNIAPLLNTVVGMPWQQPLSTPAPVAVVYQYQGSSFVPLNTAQVIVVTTIQHSNPFFATVGAMTCIN